MGAGDPTGSTRAADAWGKVLSTTGSVSTNRGYGGTYGYERNGSGLLDVGVRAYDPALGRFLQQDEVGNAAGQQYAYCGKSPTNAVDPTGKEMDFLIGCGVGVVGGLISYGASTTLSGENPFDLKADHLKSVLVNVGVGCLTGGFAADKFLFDKALGFLKGVAGIARALADRYGRGLLSFADELMTNSRYAGEYPSPSAVWEGIKAGAASFRAWITQKVW